MKKLFYALLLLCISSLAFGQGQISGAGNIGCSGATTTGTAATSGTSNNTDLFTVANTSAYAALVQLDQTSTISGGQITFGISYDTGTNFVTAPLVLNASTGAALTNPYTLVASTNQAFLIPLAGASSFRVRLTTVITGSATVTPFITLICTPPSNGPLVPDASGNIKVNINAASVSNISTNEAQINGVTPAMGSGTVSSGTQRMTLATDVALPAGTNSIGESPNTATATTTNAASACAIVSAASTNATSCKGSSGNVYGFWLINTTSTIYYLRIYNTASAPTCSSATGFIQSVPVPVNSTSGGGLVVNFAVPVGFSTGIGYCITGGSSSTDNTNAATGVFGQVIYK